MAIGGATHGWASVVYVLPIPVLAITAFYVWGGRESDVGAAIRRQLDERQANERLRVQALVGRVLSLAVAVGYMVAAAAKVTLWPWAILLGLVAVSFLVGRLIYGEHAGQRGNNRAT